MKTTVYYSAFGLTICSQLLLPELYVCEYREKVDIKISLETVPTSLKGSVPISSQHSANDVETLIEIENISRFLAIGGHTLLVEPHPNIDERSLQNFILNTGLVSLLQQRNGLTLQASAVTLGGSSILIVGSGFSGKSSLAAQFSTHGYSILTDETAFITLNSLTEAPLVNPGYPAVKLWGDAVGFLRDTWPKPYPVRPGVAKKMFYVPDRFSQIPSPVLGVILLASSPIYNEVSIDLIQGLCRFTTLTKFASRLRGDPATTVSKAHFNVSSKLINLPVWLQINRPLHTSGFEDIAQKLISELSKYRLL